MACPARPAGSASSASAPASAAASAPTRQILAAYADLLFWTQSSASPATDRKHAYADAESFRVTQSVETVTRIDVETALRASGRTDADRRNEQLAPHRELAAVINQGCLSSSTALTVWMSQTRQGVMH
jgi:hypothetical protein